MEDETSWLPAELAPVALRLARADEAVYQLSELTLNWSRGAEDRGTLDLVEVLTDAGELDLVVAWIRPIPR